tara:strand:- start:191 stop:424 length:234 start_codon:yes stop_codon:yes gene_type:complete
MKENSMEILVKELQLKEENIESVVSELKEKMERIQKIEQLAVSFFFKKTAKTVELDYWRTKYEKEHGRRIHRCCRRD